MRADPELGRIISTEARGEGKVPDSKKFVVICLGWSRRLIRPLFTKEFIFWLRLASSQARFCGREKSKIALRRYLYQSPSGCCPVGPPFCERVRYASF